MVLEDVFEGIQVLDIHRIHARRRRQSSFDRWVVRIPTSKWALVRQHLPSMRFHAVKWRPKAYRHRKREQGKRRVRVGVATLNVQGISRCSRVLTATARRNNVAVVALQETRVTQGSWKKLPGYDVVAHDDVPGQRWQRGVGIAVRRGIKCYEIHNHDDPFFVCVRATNLSTVAWVFVSVYMPHRAIERQAVWQRLSQTVQGVLQRRSSDAIVVMGDMNMRPTNVQRQVKRWLPGFSVASGNTKLQTRVTATTSSCLDYIIGNSTALKAMGTAAIMHDVDMSDHHAVVTKVTLHANPTTAVVVPHRFAREWSGGDDSDANGDDSSAKRLRQSQAFQQLASYEANGSAAQDPCPNLTTNEVAHAFVQATKQAALCCNGYKPARRVPVHQRQRWSMQPRLHPTLRRALRRRACKFTRWKHAQRSSMADKAQHCRQLKAAWQRERRLARRVAKRLHYDVWDTVLRRALESSVHSTKRMWQWMRDAFVVQGRHSGTQPMRDVETGRVTTDDAEVAKGWLSYYKSLLARSNYSCGLSQDYMTYWNRRGRVAQRGVMLEVDNDVEWSEVVATLRGMQRGKAAGDDGIHAELLHVAASDMDEGDDGPQTPFAQALYVLLCKMWATGDVPLCFSTATVISIYKSGDATLHSNYRGISLMSVTLKVLCKLLAARILSSLEEHNRLVQEQGGFRNRHEAVACMTTLVEVVQRRRAVGDATVLSFLDLRKAFDRVDHSALLYKLERIGVPPFTLRFLKSLYMSSSVHVRLSSGGYTDAAPVGRGVRQGCPLSPVLFLVFINDLFDTDGGYNPRQHGVVIPGTPTLPKLAGLMFADDVVLVSPTVSAAVKQYKHVAAWARKWGMEWNVKKCGTMQVLPHSYWKRCAVTGTRCLRKRGRRAVKRFTASMHRQGKLHGNSIPVVQQYKYLGVTINQDVDAAVMVATRLKGAWRHLHMAKPALRNHRIPLPVRVAYVRGVIVPQALYGAECWGANMARTDSIRGLQVAAMRMILRVHKRERRFTSQSAFYELGMATANISAAARAVRLYLKSMGMGTLLGSLVRDSVWKRQGKRTWSRQVPSWTTQHLLRGLPVDRELDSVPDGVWHVAVPPGAAVVAWKLPDSDAVDQIRAAFDVAATVRRTLVEFGGGWAAEGRQWHRMLCDKLRYRRLRAAPTVALQWQRKYELSRTSLAVHDSVPLASKHNRGLQLVVKARMQALAVNARPATYGSRRVQCAACPQEPETRVHLFLECPQWQQHRRCWLQSMRREAEQLGPLVLAGDARKEATLAIVLGGTAHGQQLMHWRPSLKRLLGDNGRRGGMRRVCNGRAISVALFLRGVNAARIAAGQPAL